MDNDVLAQVIVVADTTDHASAECQSAHERFAFACSAIRELPQFICPFTLFI
jgi:hypothetical protein